MTLAQDRNWKLITVNLANDTSRASVAGPVLKTQGIVLVLAAVGLVMHHGRRGRTDVRRARLSR